VNGHTQRFEAASHDCLFSAPLRLPHRKDYRSVVGHKCRVEGKDGIGMFRLMLIMVDHFSPALSQ
jgi:hypothetical protein